MTATMYALLLASTVVIAGLADTVWLRYARRYFARRFGWREVHPDEHIPLPSVLGGAAVVFLFVWVIDLGSAAGY